MPLAHRLWRWSIWLGACFIGAVSTAAADYRVEPVALDDTNFDEIIIGRLTWRGGVAISSDDARFGGVSALHISPDGRELHAVTDRGSWLTASLEYRNGRLANIRDFKLAPLFDLDGNMTRGRQADAESIAATDDHGFVVSFERTHRLWHYAGPNPTHATPTALSAPKALKNLPSNGGIEALTRLCDGRLLAISEKGGANGGGVKGWIGSAAGWSPVRYRTTAGLRPTGAATLPDCDVVFVERSFNIVAGLDIRITRVSARALDAENVLEPEELAHLSFPLTIDNFEGIAARRDAAGDTLIYIVSDDNFSAAQRTLLFMFALGE